MNASFRIISFLVIAILLLMPIYNANAQTTPNTPCGNTGPGSLTKCIGENLTPAWGFFPDPAKTSLPVFIASLIKFVLTLMGSIFLLLIIYGGFQWMTAGGNPEQAKKAAQILRNSVIGLIIIVLAYAVTITVFSIILQASGAPPINPNP